MALLECRSAAEVIENYRRVRSRVKNWQAPCRPEPAPDPIPEPSPVVAIPIPPTVTVVTVQHEQEAEPVIIRRHPSIHRIIGAVCQKYNITRNDLVSHRRTVNTVRPRHIAMYLAKNLTLKSLPEIGRPFGRDHTTVLHGVRKIALLRTHFKDLDDELTELETILGGKDVME